MRFLTSLIVWWIGSILTIQAFTIHVPEDFPTIQDGVDAAEDGDIVILADGTYSGYRNNGIRFSGKAIEVSSASGPENCIIENSDENTAFIFRDNEGLDSIVSNVTIQNCIRAIDCSAASPYIKGCIFKENYDSAINCSGQPVIENCQFLTNQSSSGGAINGQAIIKNCHFAENRAENYGGAILILDTSVVTNCTFTDNMAIQGGAIYSSSADIRIGGSTENSNTFTGNFAAIGADLSCGIKIDNLNAQGNVFEGLQTDFYFSPLHSFNLTGSQFTGQGVQADLYVRTDGNNDNDGLTWDTSLKTIGYALSRVLPDETNPVTIHIGSGVYSLTETGEKLPIPLLSDVSITGVGSQESVLDAEGATHVIKCFQDTNITLSGFTLKNADGSGLDCSNSDLVLIDCVIMDNNSCGIRCSESDLDLDQCKIMNNHSSSGAGLFSESNSFVTIDSSIISGNASSAYGGGIYCKADTFNDLLLVIKNTTFENNTAGGDGSAVYLKDGSLEITDSLFSGNNSNVVCSDMYPGSGHIIGSTFTQNTGRYAVKGGFSLTNCNISNNSESGLYLDFGSISASTIQDNGGRGIISGWGGATVENCLITRNQDGGVSASYGLLRLKNCVITENTAIETGGGIFVDWEKVTAINCLIAANTAPAGGGVYLAGYDNENTFENCTIADNTSEQGAGFYLDFGAPEIKNCIVWNNGTQEFAFNDHPPEVSFSCVRNGCEGQGNISADPGFVAGEDYDYYLSQINSGQVADSPCVNTGSDLASQICFTIFNGDICMAELWTNTTGIPDTGQVDMGVHYPVLSSRHPKVEITMPSDDFNPGDNCSCSAFVTNYYQPEITDFPLFVLLEVSGTFFFAPSFSEFDFFSEEYTIGKTVIEVLPEFIWPENSGYAHAKWYGALTDSGVTTLVSNLAMFGFSWSN